MHRLAQVKLWYAAGALLVSLLLTMILTLGIAAYMIEQNNRTWCEYLTTINSAYDAAPPPTKTGKLIERVNENQARKFKCLANGKVGD